MDKVVSVSCAFVVLLANGRTLFGLLRFVGFGLRRLVLVLEERGQVPAEERQGQWGGEAGGHEVQQRGLRVLEHVHHQDGRQQAQDVRAERSPEVKLRVPFEALIEAQQESYEDARHHDVTQPQHGKVARVQTVYQQILRKHQFDRSLEALGDGHHDVGTEHPEDVVQEESAEQDAAGHHVVQMQKLHTVNGERYSKQIIGDPVLFKQVPSSKTERDEQTDHIIGCELVIDDILFVVSLTTGEMNMERNVWYRSWYQERDDRTKQMTQC